jgi:ATP-dependent RNA helicase DDX35
MLKRFSIPVVSAKGNAEKILKCIAAGYFPNAVRMHHSGQYRTIRGNVELKIHPSSVLYELPKSPSCVVYAEVLHTTEVFMRDLTVIDQRWLVDLAPHYYKTGYLF